MSNPATKTKAGPDKSEKLDGHKDMIKPEGNKGSMLKASLSDVALFSYGGLCMSSLRDLYEDEWNKEYKNKLSTHLNQHLGLTEQVCDSMVAILNGDGVDESDPYVNSLLEDPFLKKSGLAVIFDLLTFALKDGHYDARTRVLLKRMAWHLRVKWETVESLECSVVENLTTNKYAMSEEEAKEKAKQAKRQKVKRFALIGLATLGGGTLIGLTGGLAAPLVAAGAGAIIGGAGAAALGSVAGVAIIGSLFGVAGAGLAGYKMKKRVGAVDEFEFERLVPGSGLKTETTSSKQLHITIAVTGWLTKEVKDVKQPWRKLMDSHEQYCLRWETDHLYAFGTAFDYILNAAMTAAAQEALKYTVLSTLMSAIMWPATLVSVANVIDNPWSVCVQRSVSAGKQLAEVLLSREQGHRPVTLIGYSLGARVIFCCLEELSKRKGCEGIIEDVVLLGAPVSGSSKHWAPFARVVSGKIINGFSRGDWLLKFLYRTSSAQIKIAGLHSVRWENRRMFNFDLSNVVSGHNDYMTKLDEILTIIGINTTDNKPPDDFILYDGDHSVDPIIAPKNNLDKNTKMDTHLIEENRNIDARQAEGISETKILNHAQGDQNIVNENVNVRDRQPRDGPQVKQDENVNVRDRQPRDGPQVKQGPVPNEENQNEQGRKVDTGLQQQQQDENCQGDTYKTPSKYQNSNP